MSKTRRSPGPQTVGAGPAVGAPAGLRLLPGGSLQTSYLARLGSLVAPVGAWMGLDWKLTVALLTSFFAKENSIATLGVLFGSSENAGLAQSLAR